jgi:hypothetical protein
METAVIINMARKDFVRITAPFSTVVYLIAKKTGRLTARHCMKVALVRVLKYYLQLSRQDSEIDQTSVIY